MNNTGKYALVTGASSGIGWHISEDLASRGYNLVAVSNQGDKLADLKRTLEQKYPVSVEILETDLARLDSSREVFSFCSKNMFEIEILVNDAGIFIFGEVVKVDPSRIESILNLHIITSTLLCRLFGGQMITRGKGYILNISSITAVMPYPGISLYGPTKAYIRHFTRALRSEMKVHGINVTCLIPGATATSLYDANYYNTPLMRKLGVMKNPARVAKTGVKALFRNRAECVPGFINKLTILFLPLIPHFIIDVINRRTNIVRKTVSKAI